MGKNSKAHEMPEIDNHDCLRQMGIAWRLSTARRTLTTHNLNDTI
jgi:hypothetical protein